MQQSPAPQLDQTAVLMRTQAKSQTGYISSKLLNAYKEFKKIERKAEMEKHRKQQEQAN